MRDGRQIVVQLGISVAARLAVSRDTHVEVPALDCVIASLHGSSGISGRRLGTGYIHCQRALPRQQHFVPGSPSCADAPGQQSSVRARVQTHELVHSSQ